MNKETRWKRTFFIIWAGQAFSVLGSSAAQFAIIWWLTEQTGSAVVLAMAGMVGFLPQAIIGPFAGAWVDRLSRKTVMIVADLFIAVAGGVLAVAFLLGTPAIWLVYLILFLRAVGSVFHAPALQAAIPMLVPQSELTKAGGWSQFLQSGSLMLGPVIGTLLMTTFSIPAVMLIDIIGAILAALALFMIKIADPEKTPDENILGEMLAGLLEIKKNRLLFAITIPMMLVSLIYLPVSSLFPLMVNGYFGGTAWHGSIVEFFFAGGLLVSSLILGVWGGLEDKFLMMNLSIGFLGVTLIVSGALPQTAFTAFVVLSALMGLTGSFFSVPYIAYIQSTIPAASLGRVLAILTSMMSLAIPLGLFLAGPLAERVGVASWFFYSGILIVLTAIVGHIMVRREEGKVNTSSV